MSESKESSHEIELDDIDSAHERSSLRRRNSLQSVEIFTEKATSPPSEVQETVTHRLSIGEVGDPPEPATNSIMENSGLFKILFALLVIAALLIVILVPMSFSYLEYYEMGLVKNKATGTVDRSKVYFGGRHYVGVTKTFKKFQADLHNVELNKLTIFNKEKIQVSMTCSFQYYIRHEDLGILHDTYDVNYASVVKATTQAAIKAAANQYSIDEYRLERPKVRLGLESAAAAALGGKCCRKDCIKYKCIPSCIPYDQCKKEEKGVFCALENFQMQDVSVTKEQEDRFMKKVVESEKEDTELHIQNETIVRKETEEKRIIKENQAKEILQRASANSTLIKSKAEAEAAAIVNDARNKGLGIIYAALNITDVAHKNSLDYLRTLLNHKNIDMYLGFQYMVANEGKP